jgi:hypothetical protein
LGSWHLAIVIDEKSGARWMHFLPFTHSKRDERFTDEDSNKIAPAFTNTISSNLEGDIATLREYLSMALKSRKEIIPIQKPSIPEI